MTIAPPAACSYELDRKWRIVAVDEAWSTFALANGAPELAARNPIGSPLFKHIVDDTTKHLYEQLFNRAIGKKQPTAVPLRCDSPSLRRHLTLHIEPLAHGGVRLFSTVVRVEPRDGVRLLDPDAPRTSDEWLRMCGWCKRVDLHGEWAEVEHAATELRLFERDVLPSVTHGICPACEALVSGELR